MADLAAFLSNRFGRHVVDKTGVTGIYNFTIKTGGSGHAVADLSLPRTHCAN